MAKSDFETALAAARKKYSDTNVGKMGEIVEDVEVVSTGNLAIDYIIGIGGLPLGRTVELFGPTSCGKTTTALQAAAELQKIIKAGGDAKKGIGPDDIILYMDYEATLDPDYAMALGLDINHPSFYISQPDTLEDGVNLALSLIESGMIRMVIFDSVAAMNPSAKSEAEIGKSLPAVQAKLMTDFMGKATSIFKKNNCICILLNHVKDAMNMGRPGVVVKTTPGGVALKYGCTVRLEYQQIGQIKSKIRDQITNEEIEVATATNVKVRVAKNKVGPPFRTATVRVRYGTGFDNFWTAMQILMSYKKVMYSAGYFYFHKVEDEGLAPEWMPRASTGTKRANIRTENALFKAADDHPEWKEAIIALATETLKNPGAEAPDFSDNSENNDEIPADIDSHVVSLVESENEN